MRCVFLSIICFLFLMGSIVFAQVVTPVQDQPTTTTNEVESVQLQETSERLGIVASQPQKGRFIKTESGYMVPYTATIPGTDVKFEMVPVAGGTFRMGSPAEEEDRSDDEGPTFEVKVEPFWVGKYEVTWAEYKLYMRMDRVFKAFQDKGVREVKDLEGVDAITAPSGLYEPSFTYEAGSEPTQPAATMSQFAAKQYTKWLSLISADFYRLPTEAEWEYACRAGTKTRFYFGDDADELEDHAWFEDNSDYERHAVGELKPNPWGLYDMYGNVAEWVLDQYSETGYEKHSDKKVVTAEQAFEKPDKVFPRVVRGGSWELGPEYCRSAARLASDDDEWRDEDPNYPQSPWWLTTTPGLGVGFRLFRPLAEPKSIQEKDKYWSADVPRIMKDAKNRIMDNGRGAFGLVDPDLPKAIKGLTNKDK